ncbi:MAG: DNA-directed DNA polymerase II small subunit [archaeon]
MSLQQEALKIFLDNKIQISKPALDLILEQEKPIVAAQELIQLVGPEIITVLPEHIEQHFKKSTEATISLVDSFTKNSPIKGVRDLSDFFNNRYTYFRKLLSSRLPGPTSLGNLQKSVDEKVSTIGIVCSKKTTLKGHIMIELEDPTGTLKAIIMKPEVKKHAEALVMDEVIGVAGTTKDKVIFVDEIMWPDIPVIREPKTLKEEVYAVFLSDTHIGSNKFMAKEFSRFLSWMKGGVGDDAQAELVKKIKYCFVAGDIVDGIGVYPRQDEELELANIEEQYQKAAEYFSEIPSHVKIVFSPGNHDFIRLGQPQPPLDPEVSAPLYELRNAEFVGNPSTIKIAEKDNGGLNVLMYHGVSFDTMITSDPALKDGYTQPQTVMKSLLKRRHLSPPYDTGLVASGDDQMIIRTVPDIFHTGHVHSNGSGTYRGTTLINSGTWQSQTAFQKLCGHDPTPCILPLLNLQNRELKLVDFNYSKNEH